MRAHPFPLCCLLAFLPVLLLSCTAGSERPPQEKQLQVVTTLFPLYDFARTVGGRKAHVTLLLPPGVEPHNFEPKPRDVVRINDADLFIYTGSFMEPWAEALIKGRAGGRGPIVVDSSQGVALLRSNEEEEGEHGEAGHGTHHTSVDPHIWLDLANAQKMVDTILAGFVGSDPPNKDFYEENAAVYKRSLKKLDDDFRNGLASCDTRLFVHGGHYAFAYLARRYGLTYLSVYGFSPNAEASPRHLAEIVQSVRRHDVRYVFYEELLQPRVAETIARETGARLLPLNGGHNVTREELDKGVTFTSLLAQDLVNLRIGLQCR